MTLSNPSTISSGSRAHSAALSAAPSFWQSLTLAYVPGACHTVSGLADVSVHRRRVTVTGGAPTLVHDRELGRVAAFNGSSDRLLVSPWRSLDGLKTFAISVLFRTSNAAATQTLAARYANPRHFLLYLADGKVGFHAANVTTQTFDAISTTTIATGKTYLATGIYDDTLQKVFVAVNGVVEGEATFGSASMETTGASGLAIGGRSSDGASLFNGVIALCALHERVPSQHELVSWGRDPMRFLRRLREGLKVAAAPEPIDVEADFDATVGGDATLIAVLPPALAVEGWELRGPARDVRALATAEVAAIQPLDADTLVIPPDRRPAVGESRVYLLRRVTQEHPGITEPRVLRVANRNGVAHQPMPAPLWPEGLQWSVARDAAGVALSLAMSRAFKPLGITRVDAEQRVGDVVQLLATFTPRATAAALRYRTPTPSVATQYRWVLFGDDGATHATPWSEPVSAGAIESPALSVL